MKKILIILVVLLLTGCSANYNINFTEKSIEESIEIYENSAIVNKYKDKEVNEANTVILDWEEGYDYYKRELYTTEDITGYRYTYNFAYDEYDAMAQLRKCYENFNFKYDNKITLETSPYFLCADYYPKTKEIVINITSEYEITSSNADKVSNNTHTWIINENNYKKKPIKITIDKNKKSTNSEKKK